jgi:hypothetical protein
LQFYYEQVLNGEIGPEGRQFDGVVTYSSLEHGGLGRYGDELNPWADLVKISTITTMANLIKI